MTDWSDLDAPRQDTNRLRVRMELDVPPEYSDEETQRLVEEKLHLLVEERGWRVVAMAVSLGKGSGDKRGRQRQVPDHNR
jgi:hypothetical protein